MIIVTVLYFSNKHALSAKLVIFFSCCSYSNVQSGGFYGMEGFGESDADHSLNDIERLRVQDVGEGQVKIRYCYWLLDVLIIAFFWVLTFLMAVMLQIV